MKEPISQPPDSDLLFWRMAEAMDIPLDQAIQDEKLSPATLSKMLDKCARCAAPHFCSLYLFARSDKAPRAPCFCPNRRVLARLRKGTQDDAKYQKEKRQGNAPDADPFAAG